MMPIDFKGNETDLVKVKVESRTSNKGKGCVYCDRIKGGIDIVQINIKERNIEGTDRREFIISEKSKLGCQYTK